ncbi:MAG: Hpt domain-containing protein [Pirellulales bacterium]
MSNQQMSADPIYSALESEPDLAEVVQMFVQEMPARIENLLRRYAGGDWDGLAVAAHQVKGSAGSYGFSAITPWAARVEKSARAGRSSADLRAALDGLVAMCRRVSYGRPASHNACR